MFGIFANAVVDAQSAEYAFIESAVLENLEKNVHDPDLRERLRPEYRAACKRLIMSPDFYDAIQQPNAELVTEPIERVEPGGVRTKDGVLHELDVLVLATGFHANAFMRPMKLVGRNGVTLEDAWTPRPEAYLSISMPDFPNFFMLNGPNGPVGNFSLIEVAELQFAYILQLVERLRAGRGERSRRRPRRCTSSSGSVKQRYRTRCGSPGVAVGISTTAGSRPCGRGRSRGSVRRWLRRIRPRTTCDSAGSWPLLRPRRVRCRRALRARRVDELTRR